MLNFNKIDFEDFDKPQVANWIDFEGTGEIVLPEEPKKVAKPGVFKDFIAPTAKAIPRVTGVIAGSLALLPGAGIRAAIELLPKISQDPDKLFEAGSLSKAGEIFEQIMSVPGKLIKTEEEAKAIRNIGYVMKPIEMSGEGWRLIGEAANKGLKKLGLDDTYIEPLFDSYGEAAAIFALPGVIKRIGNSTTFRRMTIPERGLVIQSLAKTVKNNPNMTEGQILRKYDNPAWRTEALGARALKAGKPITEARPVPPIVTETPKPTVKPTTELGRKLQAAMQAERKPPVVADLAKREIEIKTGKIDFEKPVPIEPMGEKPVLPSEVTKPVGAAKDGWVKEAIDYGYWDDLKQLKGYVEDVAFDAKDAMPFMKDEITRDLGIIRKRVLELESIGAEAKTYIHETDQAFDKFDMAKVGSGQGEQWHGPGIYLQEKGTFKIEQYGKNKVEATLIPEAKIFKAEDTPKGKYRDSFVEYVVENKLDGGLAKETIKEGTDLKNILPRDVFKWNRGLAKQLKQKGYDGIDIDGELVIYNPKVLKVTAKPQPTAKKAEAVKDLIKKRFKQLGYNPQQESSGTNFTNSLKKHGAKINNKEIIADGIEKISYTDKEGTNKYAYVRLQRYDIDGFVEDSIISTKEIPMEYLEDFFNKAQQEQDILEKETKLKRESNKEDLLYWIPKVRERADKINKSLMQEYGGDFDKAYKDSRWMPVTNLHAQAEEAARKFKTGEEPLSLTAKPQPKPTPTEAKPEAVKPKEVVPKKVYHGTVRDFDELDFGERYAQGIFGEKPSKAKVIFFSEKKEDADYFRSLRGEEGKVLEKYISEDAKIADFTGLTKSKDIVKTIELIESIDKEWGKLIDEGEAEIQGAFEDSVFIKNLKKAGYDGGRFVEPEKRGTTIAIINKDKILAEYPDLAKPPHPKPAKPKPSEPLTEDFKGEGIGEPTPKATKKQQGSDTTEFFSGFPIHKFPKAAKELANLYDKHIGSPLWNYLSETLPEKAGDRFALIDRINKGIILDYKKDPAFIELRDTIQFKIQQSKEVAKELAISMGKFSSAEQVRISQIIKGGVTATPKRYETAFEAIKKFQTLEKELQRLGILGKDNRFRQLTRKEISTKFKEIDIVNKKIETLRARLKPVIKTSNMVRKVSEDVSEEIISSITDTTTETFETKITRATQINEGRVKQALLDRGFAEGEATQMIARIKDSVIPLEGKKGTLKEIRETIKSVVTKTIIQEVEKLKTYSPSIMARARGSIVKDINKEINKRNEILNRIRLHYKMSGKLYLRRAYEKIEGERGFLFKLMGYASKRPRLIKGYNIRRQDLSYFYRKGLGEIKKAPYLVYKGISEETHDVLMMSMFNNISANKDWVISPERLAAINSGINEKLILKYKNFKPLPVTKRLGKLSGQLVDPYIWDDLNQSVVQVNDMIKAWDSVLKLWKTGKVVYNPATQGRNMLSNTILADFGGLPPHRIDVYALAAKELLTKGQYWREAKQTPLLGTEWAGTEIKQFLVETSELKEGSFLSNLSKTTRSLLDKPGQLYQGTEQFFKLAVFINERKNGRTIKEAGAHAEKTMFNYLKIPPAIRWAKRWYSPFITFSYKAIPRFAETAIRKPWKIVKYGLLMLAVEEIARRMYGESKEEVEQEKKVLPDYMRKSVLPGQLSHMRIPYKDKYNRSKYLDLSFILPWGDIAEQWGQSRLVGRPLLPSHPLYVAVAEIAFNEVLFTGQELTTKDVDTGSDYLKKIGIQLWRQAVPSLAGSYSYNKLMAAYKGEVDWALRDRSLPEAMFDVFLGLKIRSIDYTEERGRRLKYLRGRIDAIKERFKKDYSKIVYNPTPDLGNDQQRTAKLYLKMNEQIDKILEKITEIEE